MGRTENNQIETKIERIVADYIEYELLKILHNNTSLRCTLGATKNNQLIIEKTNKNNYDVLTRQARHNNTGPPTTPRNRLCVIIVSFPHSHMYGNYGEKAIMDTTLGVDIRSTYAANKAKKDVSLLAVRVMCGGFRMMNNEYLLAQLPTPPDNSTTSDEDRYKYNDLGNESDYSDDTTTDSGSYGEYTAAPPPYFHHARYKISVRDSVTIGYDMSNETTEEYQSFL